MHKGRLEAFSDGVLAIIITIMVLDLKTPHETELESLYYLAPTFFSYVLSFLYVGIYWNNHHHLLQVSRRVNGSILWANLHVLFWLSLIPFMTGWMGATNFGWQPVLGYGIVLLMSNIAYSILVAALKAHHSPDSPLALAVKDNRKQNVSLFLNAAALPLDFVHPAISLALYIVIALIWLVPDRRMEKVCSEHGSATSSGHA
jgi:uncharacterized membrane protein